MTSPVSGPFQISTFVEFFCFLEPAQSASEAHPAVYNWKFQRNAQSAISDFVTLQNLTHVQGRLSFRFIWFFCSASSTLNDDVMTIVGSKLVEYQGMPSLLCYGII